MGRPKATKREQIAPFFNPEKWRAEELRFKEVETREETKARIGRETLAATHRVFRETAAYATFCLIMLVVISICIWIVLRQAYSAETQKWASTLLTTIVSAGVGYLTGKANGKGEA